MSRAYKVRVAESLSRHVKVGDGVQTKLEILDVLAPEAMRELLRQELAEAGFEECGGEMCRTDEDGVETRIDLDKRTVTVSATVEKELELKVELDVRAMDDDAGVEAASRQRVTQDLEREMDDCEGKLRQDVTDAIAAKLGDINKELVRVTNRVTSAALKKKAASMGEIREMSENPETGELIIRIKL